MAARKSSRIHPKFKTKYRVKNWKTYEAGLRNRGSLTIWFSPEAIENWTPEPTGQPGGQCRYSDLAILTALSLRSIFHLPLRQTEGFVDSLLRLLDLDLTAPDHTTLSRRNKDIKLPHLSTDFTKPLQPFPTPGHASPETRRCCTIPDQSGIAFTRLRSSGNGVGAWRWCMAQP